MVALWVESVAVGVQIGVVYPAVSTVLFELSSRSSFFSLLLVPGVVFMTVFVSSSAFEGVGFLLTTGP